MLLNDFFSKIKRSGNYSNNFWLFCRKLNKKYPNYPVEFHYREGIIYFGVILDIDCGFVGSNAISICCNGSKETTANYLYLNEKTKVDLVETYINYGRNIFIALGYDCWIDGFKGDKYLKYAEKIVANVINRSHHVSIKVSDDQNTVWVDGKEHVACNPEVICSGCDLDEYCSSKITCAYPYRKDMRNVIFKLKSEVENELD